MKHNSLFHISGGVVKIDQVTIYNETDKKRNKNEEKEEADDSDHSEVVEVKPMPTDNLPCPSASKLVLLIIRKELALTIRDWLHSKMDPLEDARDKLLYLRAICEAGYLPRLIKLSEYSEEFGPIKKSTYYDWMGTSLKYTRGEIDGIIENLPFR